MDLLKEHDWSQAPGYTDIETTLKHLTPINKMDCVRNIVVIFTLIHPERSQSSDAYHWLHITLNNDRTSEKVLDSWH